MPYCDCRSGQHPRPVDLLENFRKTSRAWHVAPPFPGAGRAGRPSGGMACPDLSTAVQVGACPSEEELRYTFTGYCSDDAKAYRGETDSCTDFALYRQMKNVALWESKDGVFDAYLSCELPKGALKQAKASAVRVAKAGKITQLQCSYGNGVTFTYRTRAQCTVDSGADCAGNPSSRKADCD